MQIRCTKPWLPINTAALEALPGQLGIFELADAAGCVIFIGRADARSLFGLRSEVTRRAREIGDATAFRYEVTTAYHTRHLELLMVHQADHGSLPVDNAKNPPPNLGRLSPS